MFSQLITQVPLLQPADPCDAAPGQGEQRPPHVLTSLFDTHIPLQLCVFAGHWPLQAWLLLMHWPLQIFWPLGQAGTQLTPSQLTDPPDGDWQALHELPQVATALFCTHLPLQR